MTLIACPQLGCNKSVSPTARSCPSCGFDMVAYFGEDDSGFSDIPELKTFSNWRDQGNGTIVDVKTGLTWLRAPMVWLRTVSTLLASLRDLTGLKLHLDLAKGT